MKNKLKITAGIFTVVFCILLGCERRDAGQENLLLPVEGTAAHGDAGTGTALPEESGVQGGNGSGDGFRAENAPAGDTPVEDAGAKKPLPETCTVHICGAVNRPGVYVMEGESRIYQAVEMAGGFRADAHEDYLNQADLLLDGMKIYVPTKEEVEESGEGKRLLASAGEGGALSTKTEENSSLVNINTAGEDLLCTLSGVGSSRAKSIIAYREKNGAFQKIEDIMKVEGIKDGLFQKIKDSITV